MVEFFDATVETVEHVTGDLYLLRLRDCEALASSQPGQFAMLRPRSWQVDPVLARPFSIFRTSGDRADFLIRTVGRGTDSLVRCNAGERIDVLGPVGTAFPSPSHGPTVLVAGGVGLAPIGLWIDRADDGMRADATLIYGARTADDLVFLDELSQRVAVVVTTEDGSFGRKGLVTDEMVSLLDGCAEVLTCGPTRMMAHVARLAGEARVSCHVSLEARMACGRGICLGCAVPGVAGPLLVCRDGPVLPAGHVDWEQVLV